MTVSYRAIFELGLACMVLAGAGVSWVHARYPVPVAPVADGQPATMSVSYDPQQLVLTFLLAATGGVLVVVGAARMRRARPRRSPAEAS